MTINSTRLTFRPYQDEDFDFLFSLLSDPEMVRYIGDGKVRDRISTRKFLDWIYKTYNNALNMGLMVLVRKDNNIPIGHAGLVPQTIDGEEEIEIGYWIAREYWGQGYATEAALTLRNYGMNNSSKQRLISLIQPNNIASQKVAQKIGMKLEREIILAGKDVFVFSTNV